MCVCAVVIYQARKLGCQLLPLNSAVYLCLVLAAAALKVAAAEIGDGDQTAEVADVDAVWITDLKQSFTQELCCAVSYLTVALHLTKPQATVPDHTHACLSFYPFFNINLLSAPSAHTPLRACSFIKEAPRGNNGVDWRKT